MAMPATGLNPAQPAGPVLPAATLIDPMAAGPPARSPTATPTKHAPACAYWAWPARSVLPKPLGQRSRSSPWTTARLKSGDATLSFHSAGHVLGSARIRPSAGSETWLIKRRLQTGDTQLRAVRACAPMFDHRRPPLA